MLNACAGDRALNSPVVRARSLACVFVCACACIEALGLTVTLRGLARASSCSMSCDMRARSSARLRRTRPSRLWNLRPSLAGSAGRIQQHAMAVRCAHAGSRPTNHDEIHAAMRLAHRSSQSAAVSCSNLHALATRPQWPMHR
jgi:hypothetical protein